MYSDSVESMKLFIPKDVAYTILFCLILLFLASYKIWDDLKYSFLGMGIGMILIVGIEYLVKKIKQGY